MTSFASRTCDSCDSEQRYRNVSNSVNMCDNYMRNNHSCNNLMFSKLVSASKRCNNVYRTSKAIFHWWLLATLIVLRPAHQLVETLIRPVRLLVKSLIMLRSKLPLVETLLRPVVTSLIKLRSERPLVETLQRSGRLLVGSHGKSLILVAILSMCCFQRCSSASKGELTI